MANQDHVKLIKQGGEVINAWVDNNPGAVLDLSNASLQKLKIKNGNLKKADFSRADLRKAEFFGCDLSFSNFEHTDCRKVQFREKDFKGNRTILSGVNFSHSDLRNANFEEVLLNNANLEQSNMEGADLHNVFLQRSTLHGTNLRGAELSDANFYKAKIKDADLSGARLWFTRFFQTILNDVDFGNAVLNGTVFQNVDLSTVHLDSTQHYGPSTIDVATLFKSKGKISEIFLRKAGLPDPVINFIPALIGTLNPIDFSSVFISYSSKNKDFARRLYNDLQGEGIRCWLDEKEILPGDDITKAIDQGIKTWDYVLLCCSKPALTSWWVDDELDKVFAKERNMREGSDFARCLIPITLDDYVFDEWNHEFKNRILRLHVEDFREWSNHENYKVGFERIVRKLRIDADERLSAKD